MCRIKILFLMVIAVGISTFGCKHPDNVSKAREIPIHITGTVSEYAGYVGLTDQPVRGYGVVAYLGKNGSSEVPPQLRQYLLSYLHKQDLGSWCKGTPHIEPAAILSSMDTAIVEVFGRIPYGAPRGSRFDVYVKALAQTQTRNLDSGLLMTPTELFPFRGDGLVATGTLDLMAVAGGEMFVNPFVDRGKPSLQIKLRQGRVIGGGVVKKPLTIFLVMKQASHSTCSMIASRIEERFRDQERRIRVAHATNDSTIKIQIPYQYRNDYRHFLELVLHLPLHRSQAADERHIRRILQAMHQIDARHHKLSLVLEAMGRQAIPMIQAQYDSKDPFVAFYSARAALRLGDDMAAATILRTAKTTNSPLQIPAIEELGRHGKIHDAIKVLRELVNGKNELVRLAAYEALVKYGDDETIRRIDVGKHFILDLVKSSSSPVIYATRSHQQKIVLFGDAKVNQSVFLSLPDDLVTLSNVVKDKKKKLAIYRKIARRNLYSNTFYIDFEVSSLVKTLGSPAERDLNKKIRGMALHYGQVLRVLHRMCKSGGINAKFVLQRPSDLQRIYQGAAATGRPDAPD